MKTITIQIGNSDDKLTQKEWCRFVANVQCAVDIYSKEIHFFATSPGDREWQNAAWVLVPKSQDARANLLEELHTQREAHKQDSVAWTEGDTSFV